MIFFIEIFLLNLRAIEYYLNNDLLIYSEFIYFCSVLKLKKIFFSEV